LIEYSSSAPNIDNVGICKMNAYVELTLESI